MSGSTIGPLGMSTDARAAGRRAPTLASRRKVSRALGGPHGDHGDVVPFRFGRELHDGLPQRARRSPRPIARPHRTAPPAPGPARTPRRRGAVRSPRRCSSPATSPGLSRCRVACTANSLTRPAAVPCRPTSPDAAVGPHQHRLLVPGQHQLDGQPSRAGRPGDHARARRWRTGAGRRPPASSRSAARAPWPVSGRPVPAPAARRGPGWCGPPRAAPLPQTSPIDSSQRSSSSCTHVVEVAADVGSGARRQVRGRELDAVRDGQRAAAATPAAGPARSPRSRRCAGRCRAPGRPAGPGRRSPASSSGLCARSPGRPTLSVPSGWPRATQRDRDPLDRRGDPDGARAAARAARAAGRGSASGAARPAARAAWPRRRGSSRRARAGRARRTGAPRTSDPSRGTTSCGTIAAVSSTSSECASSSLASAR